MEMHKLTKSEGLLWITLLVQLLFAAISSGVAAEPAAAGGGVKVNATATQVTLSNDLVDVTFAVPAGYVTGIKFGGIENVLNVDRKVSDRGYWDIASASNPDKDDSDEIPIRGTSFKVITETPEKAEISFLMPKTPALALQVDLRYVLLKGRSGYYAYAVFDRATGLPPLGIDQIRTVHKLQPKQFPHMAVSDTIQRTMPIMRDRETGKPLAYKEAVLLTNPVEPKMKGEVDDKYQYACEDKDNKLHGWVSLEPAVGIWIITPTDEFRMGGPHKQDLTSHAGPNMLSMFHSTHYGGADLIMSFKQGEPWKKVFGPYLVHLNSLPGKADPPALWKQAKEQLATEIKSWPYDFVESPDFPKAAQRGSVEGKLLVNDGEKPVPGKSAWVGLSPPGEPGSWQYQTKGYQFWVQADAEGAFVIPHVRVGEYNLFAWVPGFIGDFKSEKVIKIEPGKSEKLGDITFTPPRNGPTLWDIGIADRSAAEFFVPDPDPTLVNPVFVNQPENKYRQYGLWDRYTEVYPKEDLAFTVGVSDFKKEWFFAHCLRKAGEKYESTIWRVIFPLKEVPPSGNYTLQIALASAAQAELQVRINCPDPNTRPLFTTLLIGKDNALARHGIHGLYRLYTIGVPSTSLKVGENTIFLRQSRHNEKFRSVMYDYLRLEGPGAGPKKA